VWGGAKGLGGFPETFGDTTLSGGGCVCVFLGVGAWRGGSRRSVVRAAMLVPNFLFGVLNPILHVLGQPGAPACGPCGTPPEGPYTDPPFPVIFFFLVFFPFSFPFLFFFFSSIRCSLGFRRFKKNGLESDVTLAGYQQWFTGLFQACCLRGRRVWGGVDDVSPPPGTFEGFFGGNFFLLCKWAFLLACL